MKIVQNQAAQGDIFLRRAPVPSNAIETARAGARLVVAHSETGHDHYVPDDGVTLWQDPTDTLVCYLRVAGPHADVIHARGWDTHETLRLPTGTWEVRRQREMTPEGWRRVED